MSTLCVPPRTAQRTLPSWLRQLCRPHERLWSSLLVLTALSVVLFFYGLGSGQFWRTESLRAIIAQEFLRTGNWLIPRLYGEPLFTKPPGMYAAIALCSLPFGQVTEWSARLPSALAATGTVFLMWWFCRRRLGPLGGLLVAVVVPLSLMWLDKATASEIDMLHLGLTTAAILLGLRAVEAAENQELSLGRQSREWAGWQWWFWLAALFFVALGFLTKWMTPVFFYLTLLPVLIVRRKTRLLWCGPHLVGLLLAGGLVLAWIAAAIALEGWEVFFATVSNEALQRLSPAHSPYPYPWGETLVHPLRLLLIGLPFSALALLTLRRRFWQAWDEKGQRLLQELHCWVWPAMLFMTFPTEHAPRHSLPLYPALSTLGALVLLAGMTGRLPWRFSWLPPGRLLMAVLIVWVMLKVAFVEVVMPARNSNRQPRAKAELLRQLIPENMVLYISRLKDEGIMFYYGRTVQRVRSPAEVPPGPAYCVLVPRELEQWQQERSIEVLRHMTDEQGDPMVVVLVRG